MFRAISFGLGPCEFVAAKGDEFKCGFADADFVPIKQFFGRQNRLAVQAHNIRLAAVSKEELVQLLVKGDGGVVVTADCGVAKIKRYGLIFATADF